MYYSPLALLHGQLEQSCCISIDFNVLRFLTKLASVTSGPILGELCEFEPGHTFALVSRFIFYPSSALSRKTLVLSAKCDKMCACVHEVRRDWRWWIACKTFSVLYSPIAVWYQKFLRTLVSWGMLFNVLFYSVQVIRGVPRHNEDPFINVPCALSLSVCICWKK